MLRAKYLAALGALAASAILIPLDSASAKPLPIASADELESMTRQVDYRQCYWADGYRLCRTFYVDEPGDQALPPGLRPLRRPRNLPRLRRPGRRLPARPAGASSTTATAAKHPPDTLSVGSTTVGLGGFSPGPMHFRAGTMSAISERARAKINLTLRVLGRRADGYHLLESLIVFAGVGDAVTFEPGAPAAVEMSGPYASAIAGGNLVDTALAALAAADPILTLGRVSVDKQLPIAAGIGGGSSDAAAVLRAVRRINPANGVDWERLAAALGADVSVCLADRSSLVWGVGEHVEPVEGLPRLDAVLVCPQSAAPFGKTKSVFGRLAVGEAATASRRSRSRRSTAHARSSTTCAASATTCARPPMPFCPTAPQPKRR